MRSAAARGIVGAAIAAGALTASMAVPRPLAEGPYVPPVLPLLDGTVSCGVTVACPAPGRDEWQRLVEARLATRLPGLAEPNRGRLADAILDESWQAELDPLFVLALIEVESGYDPDALSHRGARGLMQLRPATLRGEVTRSRLEGSDPYDPILNVRAGVRYYRRLLDAFRNPDLALMAYNAGPKRISAYLKSGEVPERFHAYPRNVRAEVHRLRKSLAGEPQATVAQGGALQDVR
jgi:soluble lytic murein transglycosylase-like protein